MLGSGGCDHFLILAKYDKLPTLSKTRSPVTNLKHCPNPATAIIAATDCTATKAKYFLLARPHRRRNK